MHFLESREYWVPDAINMLVSRMWGCTRLGCSEDLPKSDFENMASLRNTTVLLNYLVRYWRSVRPGSCHCSFGQAYGCIFLGRTRGAKKQTKFSFRGRSRRRRTEPREKLASKIEGIIRESVPRVKQEKRSSYTHTPYPYAHMLARLLDTSTVSG